MQPIIYHNMNKNANYLEEEDEFNTNYIPVNDEDELGGIRDGVHHQDVTIIVEEDEGTEYVAIKINNTSSYFKVPDDVEEYRLVSFHQGFDVVDGGLCYGTINIVMVKGDPENDVGRWWTIRVPMNG